MLKNLKFRASSYLEKSLTSQHFFPEFGFNLMCHNLMRLWHIFQNNRFHRIVTHQVGTKFWKKVFGCLAFLSYLYVHAFDVLYCHTLNEYVPIFIFIEDARWTCAGTNNSWRHQGRKAQAMGITTQGNAASPRGISNSKNEPDHLLVLVHGILARYMLIKDYAQNSIHRE
jgi:hypothetical protein